MSEQWDAWVKAWSEKNAWRWDGTITQAERRAWENVDRLYLLYLWTAVGQAAELKQARWFNRIWGTDE